MQQGPQNLQCRNAKKMQVVCKFVCKLYVYFIKSFVFTKIFVVYMCSPVFFVSAFVHQKTRVRQRLCEHIKWMSGPPRGPLSKPLVTKEDRNFWGFSPGARVPGAFFRPSQVLPLGKVSGGAIPPSPVWAKPPVADLRLKYEALSADDTLLQAARKLAGKA